MNWYELVIQVYALTSNTEEAEVEWFYEDLQDLFELTPKKDMTPKDESPRSECVQYATGEEGRTTTHSPRKNKVVGPKQK